MFSAQLQHHTDTVSSSEHYITHDNLKPFHHGLYGNTSGCINQLPSQWERANFDPPQLQNHLTDFDEIWTLELLPSPRRPPPCKISFWSDNVGGLGKYPVCHLSRFFVFLFGLFVMRTSRTGGPILTIHTSYKPQSRFARLWIVASVWVMLHMRVKVHSPTPVRSRAVASHFLVGVLTRLLSVLDD